MVMWLRLSTVVELVETTVQFQLSLPLNRRSAGRCG